MAYHWSDNVLTTAFTPRDYQVELLAAAREKNIIICLGHYSSKDFISLKIIHELGYELRSRKQKKATLYLTSNANSNSTYNLIYHLTDLRVINLNEISKNRIEWENLFDEYQVVILDLELCLDGLICGYIDLNEINLVVIDDCHKNYGNYELSEIFNGYYTKCESKPKILGLAGPLHSAECAPGRLGGELEYLEKSLFSKAETASDIVTVLRYCSKPIEIILQCAPPEKTEITEFLRNLVLSRRTFIEDHRFDPSEIYEGFLDELKVIPDPKTEPIKFLNEFLEILNELGPWSADRAALLLLVQIEKCKINTPYERHYLLLCLISTTLVQIRAHCDYVLQKLPNEKDRIEKYSTPKVLRLLEILRKFKPSHFNINKESSVTKQKVSNASNKSAELVKLDLDGISPQNVKNIEKIESIDFGKLADSIDKVKDNISNSVSNLAKRVTDGLNNVLNGPPNDTAPVQHQPSNRGGGGYRKRFRQRGGYHNNTTHPFHHHHHNSQRKYHYSYYQNESDALCGIIFCNSKFVAKILFGLLCEMTRNDNAYKYLNVQYTVDKEANPLNDLKEAEAEHRKQEEVLKRFRMHECNLLIGTTVLEEGIDLPKCNLVIRWDVPTTYRSYVQCKGRARAQNAYHIIMVSSHPDLLNENIKNNELYQKIHRFSCGQNQEDRPTIDGDKDSSNNDETSSKICLLNDESKETINSEIHDLELTKYFANLDSTTNEVIERLAQYMEIEKMLIRKCENMEPSETELLDADKFTQCIEEYRPIKSKLQSAFVNLSTAVSLVNKYCAKLPSDTFTKLTPLWRSARTMRNDKEYFQCTLRLPINSPVKQDIIGFPMITRILARRSAALVACKILHEYGELDNNLQPIGKESFRANEPDWENFELEEEDEQIVSDNSEPRPGTTKRRQYYYKRIASTFSKCRPNAGEVTYLYHISMILTCPIPEEQNTRGRKIYPPEDAIQGFGILTTKKIPKVSSFPIFTRSGEVKVSLELTKHEIILDETQLHKIYTFINYTFTNVLRLKKYLMLFDPEATENSFFIVPTIRETNKTDDCCKPNEVAVDWNFLDLINDNIDKMPQHVSDEERKNTAFNPDKFKDAVVMPWYRNQDQPQYFYVAEICYHLSPNSSFPGENYTTFQEYYFRKYGIEIQNNMQPLLDVDHTSARLNFLTPRYVNRKGVALPTSSEETKRAKRENLEQKQILVPELCTIHPFPASLWRAAVCLPCILYRINALLLADEIRKQVALDLGLGKQSMDYEHFEWSTLDFGWSLADVLRKSREARIAQSDNLIVAIQENGYAKKFKEKSYENIATIVELDEQFNNLSLEDAEKTANDILEEADQKLKNATMMEIGIWSNDMAENVVEEKDSVWSQIPPNINICSRKTSQIRYGSPTSWGLTTTAKDNQFTSSTENLFSDSDVSYRSDDEVDTVSNTSNDNTNPHIATNNLNGLRIEFKSDNVAEAIETEEELIKREKQLAIINDRNINEKNYQISKNICSGYNNCYNNSEDDHDDVNKCENIANILYHEKLFLTSISSLKQFILKSNKLIKFDQELNIIQLNEHNSKSNNLVVNNGDNLLLIYDLISYLDKTIIDNYLLTIYDSLDDRCNIKLKIDDLFELNKMYIDQNCATIDCNEKYTIEGTGDIFDNFNDQHINDSKEIIINFHNANKNIKQIENNSNSTDSNDMILSDLIRLNSEVHNTLNGENSFSFDYQPNLNGHPGPSPSIILQGLTMSNANDGINLERLETIGDSFLKYAITTYLYCAYENVHEGKLSHLRSKQVSNLNLYRLGRRKNLGENMIATKFEPHDNWLPPCYYVPRELEKALIEAKIPACHWNLAELPNLKRLSSDEICALVKQRAESLGLMDDLDDYMNDTSNSNPNGIVNLDNFPCFIPYNLVTQHSIPDKSIADCVEALIGAYLIECGPRGALLFMAWLGIRVLPIIDTDYDTTIDRIPGSLETYVKNDKTCQKVYGHWSPPKSPLLRHVPNAEDELNKLLDGYDAFENAIGYYFNDRSYLLQAMTHASYSPNRLTDCYQRLEFLGDAVLDYLITRHLYEDPRQHSPGALTDLRSALVNNTIFASLAVRHGFHKYFRHLSPGLNEVIDRFVRIQHENGHSISEEFYLLSEEECDEAEDVEVPKALGDVFESVAGAIFLDSNMSLDTVWKIYSNMMRPEIEQFSNSVPKSPIRELLELEPETAKFGKPEKLADGRRVRVTVEVFGKGTFRGIGRNYRIAKCTAAKCALRQLKKQGLISKKH